MGNVKKLAAPIIVAISMMAAIITPLAGVANADTANRSSTKQTVQTLTVKKHEYDWRYWGRYKTRKKCVAAGIAAVDGHHILDYLCQQNFDGWYLWVWEE